MILRRRPGDPCWPFGTATRQSGAGLAKPDAVYRADDETHEHLQSPASEVIVRRAWIDTGPFGRAKPRWVGMDDGVAVPHRRSPFGRWYVSRVTRNAEIGRVVPLEAGPPDPRAAALPSAEPRSPHRLAGMIAWRLLAVALGIAVAFYFGPDGRPAQVSDEL